MSYCIIYTTKAVKAAGANILRGGVVKPRTSPYAFQGLGMEGIELMKKAKEETGLPKDSVAVIHLIGAVNKFCLEKKVSRLSEENYQKLVEAVVKLVANE